MWRWSQSAHRGVGVAVGVLLSYNLIETCPWINWPCFTFLCKATVHNAIIRFFTSFPTSTYHTQEITRNLLCSPIYIYLFVFTFLKSTWERQIRHIRNVIVWDVIYEALIITLPSLAGIYWLSLKINTSSSSRQNQVIPESRLNGKS